MAILTAETNEVMLGRQVHTMSQRGKALREEEIASLNQLTCIAVRRSGGIGVGDCSASGARSRNR